MSHSDYWVTSVTRLVDGSRPRWLSGKQHFTVCDRFSHFVTSMTAPVASGWSGRRVGLAPTGKRRLCTAHTQPGHCLPACVIFAVADYVETCIRGS